MGIAIAHALKDRDQGRATETAKTAIVAVREDHGRGRRGGVGIIAIVNARNGHAQGQMTGGASKTRAFPGPLDEGRGHDRGPARLQRRARVRRRLKSGDRVHATGSPARKVPCRSRPAIRPRAEPGRIPRERPHLSRPRGRIRRLHGPPSALLTPHAPKSCTTSALSPSAVPAPAPAVASTTAAVRFSSRPACNQGAARWPRYTQ